MILTADFHTHTPYSHGKNTVDENVARAKELGLTSIGITDHGFSHIIYGLRRRKFADYKKECKAAEEKYGVKVLVGIESNIRGESGLTDLTEKDYENFDLFLCGHHILLNYETLKDWMRYFFFGSLPARFGWKGTKKLAAANTKSYIAAIQKNPIDIITHLNFLAPCDVVEVAKCAADYGTYIELNGKKEHLSDEQLLAVADTGVRFVIDSDAHSADRVGDFERVREQLSRLNFPLDRIDNIDGRTPAFRFADYKKRM